MFRFGIFLSISKHSTLGYNVGSNDRTKKTVKNFIDFSIPIWGLFHSEIDMKYAILQIVLATYHTWQRIIFRSTQQKILKIKSQFCQEPVLIIEQSSVYDPCSNYLLNYSKNSLGTQNPSFGLKQKIRKGWVSTKCWHEIDCRTKGCGLDDFRRVLLSIYGRYGKSTGTQFSSRPNGLATIYITSPIGRGWTGVASPSLVWK